MSGLAIAFFQIVRYAILVSIFNDDLRSESVDRLSCAYNSGRAFDDALLCIVGAILPARSDFNAVQYKVQCTDDCRLGLSCTVARVV